MAGKQRETRTMRAHLDGEGKCYEDAGRFFLELTEHCNSPRRFLLVHGVLRLPSGRTMEHAWVEDTEENAVYDPSVKISYSADYFNQLVIKYRAHYQDRDVAIRLHSESGNWGPVRWLRLMGIEPSPRMDGFRETK